MPNLMKTLTIGSSTYEVCDASAREILESKASYADVDAVQATADAALPKAGGDMTGAINMNGQPISGLNDPTEDTQAARKGYVDAAKTAANAYTDASVRKAAPRNLLDNSDFTNLVAQADIGGNHGTIPYAADRWILDSGTVSYEAGVGLTLNGTIRQKLEFPPTGKTSAFVGMASGEASISYADGAVTITSSGGVLKWAALYSGVYTAATMPEYQPKGYGAEMAECQRYYVKYNGRYITSGCLSGGGKNYYMAIFTPVSMRAKPSCTMEGWKARTADGYSKHTSTSYIAPTSLSINNQSMNNFALVDSIGTAVDANNINVSYEINKLECSADL